MNFKKISGARPDNFRNIIYLQHSQKNFDIFVDDFNSLYSRYCFGSSEKIKHLMRTVYPQLIGLRQYIYQKIEDQTSFEKFEFSGRSLTPSWGFKSVIKGKWQYLRKRVWSNSPKSLIFELPTPAIMTFAQKTGRRAAYLPPSYFNGIQLGKNQATDEIYSLSTNFAQDVSKMLEKNFGARGSKEFLNGMENYLRTLFTSADEAITQISAKLKCLNYENVLAQSVGNPFLRLILSASRVTGKHIIGFTHANELSFFSFRMDTANLSLLTMMDSVIVSTEKMKSLAYESMKVFFPPGEEPRIIVQEHVDYKGMMRRLASPSRGTKIKDIMIIDRGLSLIRYPGFTTYWPVTIDLNIRIAKLLRENGFYVTLKYHPDNRDCEEVNELYKTCFDRIIYEPFEKVSKEADLFIFPHHMATSTLVPAIMTGKPIIGLSTILDWVTPLLLPQISTRVNFIQAHFNDQNFIDFSEEELIALLKNSLATDPHPAFIRDYLMGN